MDNRLAFLMSSCDAYEDLWDPFFECIEKCWSDIPYPLYLNTEHIQYHPGKSINLKVTTINQTKEKKMSWSKRFIDVLNRIPQEYIFLVLDDFFLCDKADNSYFEEVLNILDRDNSIASFQLCGTRMRNANADNYELSERLKYDLIWENGWRTHFVPTIWRKSVLLKWLRSWESIWGFELYGSARARRWNYKEKVYVVSSPPIYDYLWIKDCSAVINSKWLDEKELLEFFKVNNIEIDFSKRGKMTYEEYMSKTMLTVMQKYKPHEIIIKSINRFRSFF